MLQYREKPLKVFNMKFFFGLINYRRKKKAGILEAPDRRQNDERKGDNRTTVASE